MATENKNKRPRRNRDLMPKNGSSIPKNMLSLEVRQIIEETIQKHELTLRQKTVEIWTKCRVMNLPLPSQATIYRFASYFHSRH